jgi:hypothetical protein
MKIKLMTDRATFDQSATCTDIQLDASLDGYESTVRTMILRAYPDAVMRRGNSICSGMGFWGPRVARLAKR